MEFKGTILPFRGNRGRKPNLDSKVNTIAKALGITAVAAADLVSRFQQETSSFNLPNPERVATFRSALESALKICDAIEHHNSDEVAEATREAIERGISFSKADLINLGVA